MRVCVIGSHGTGKTTICKDISEHFGFNYIADVVPQAFKLNFEVNENTPPETQFWILSKQLELERNTPIPWVMEKSLWDNIIYGEFSVADLRFQGLMREIVERNARYDLIFYLPIEFPIEDDGLRSLDPGFQKAIDDKFKTYLKQNNIKFTELRGSREERFKSAKGIIENFLA